MIGIDHKPAPAFNCFGNGFAQSDIVRGSEPGLQFRTDKTHVHDGRCLAFEAGDMVVNALSFQHHAVAVSWDTGPVCAAD